MKKILALDIGGTKLSAAYFDGQRLSCRKTVPTLAAKGVGSVIERIAALLCGVMESAGFSDPQAIGVACPGPLSVKTGVVSRAPTLGWRDVPLVQVLAKRFGCRVVLESDTNAAAYGEWKFGAGIGTQSLAYITVSTGVGCGLIVGGRILYGAHEGAGELGHLNMEIGGRPCVCGRRGCLEAYASGTGLEATYLARYGRKLDAAAIARAARSGDKGCLALYEEAGVCLGKAIACLQMLVDPQCVVMGGSVCAAMDLFAPALTQTVRVQSYWGECPERWLRDAALRPDSGLYGAGLLACEALGNDGEGVCQ